MEHDFRLPMRNWNQTHILGIVEQLAIILDYLWGIETGPKGEKGDTGNGILDYLWGIETYTFHNSKIKSIWF
mgnify:CR=1 FL=1